MMSEKEILKKYQEIILDESIKSDDYDTLSYLLENYKVSLDKTHIKQLIYHNKIDIIKKHFKVENFNRKEIKSLLVSSAESNNLEMMKFYLDECDIFPTLSCFIKSFYANTSFLEKNRIPDVDFIGKKENQLVFNYLLNHKTFPEIFNRYKDNSDILNGELLYVMRNRDRELKMKRVKK